MIENPWDGSGGGWYGGSNDLGRFPTSPPSQADAARGAARWGLSGSTTVACSALEHGRLHRPSNRLGARNASVQCVPVVAPLAGGGLGGSPGRAAQRAS